MADSLRKYHNRAFRYVLRPQDNHEMRFALQGTRGATEQTYLLNLSETGCAFLIDAGLDIQMGERIKVELPVPAGEQIAWWGRVVRIEEHDPSGWLFSSDSFRGDETRIKVGVRFEPLPEGHAVAIRKGLENSFMRAMRDQQHRNYLYYRTLAMRNLWKGVAIAVLTAVTGGLLYYFTLPSDTYDAERGAPWGERYKIFDK